MTLPFPKVLVLISSYIAYFSVSLRLEPSNDAHVATRSASVSVRCLHSSSGGRNVSWVIGIFDRALVGIAFVNTRLRDRVVSLRECHCRASVRNHGATGN